MRTIMLLLATFVCAVLWAACGTTGQVKGQTTTPFGKVRFNIELGTFEGESPFDGWCYEITWYDKDGKEIGAKSTGGVGANGKFGGTLPTGAVSYETSFFPCEEDLGGGSGNTLVAATGAAHAGVFIASAPMVPTTNYRAYAFAVDAANLGEAKAIVGGMLAAGTSIAPPPQVRVMYWVEGRYARGAVRAYSFLPVSPAGVIECRLEIGGAAPHVTLVPDGVWTRASTVIPLRTLAGSVVTGQIAQQTVLDPGMVFADATYEL